jgi:hypothetical protein
MKANVKSIDPKAASSEGVKTQTNSNLVVQSSHSRKRLVLRLRSLSFAPRVRTHSLLSGLSKAVSAKTIG